MEEFHLNKIPKTNFVFDFKLPNGFLPFGYSKNTLSFNIFKKFEVDENKEFTLYYSSIENPNDFICKFGSPFTTYILEHTKNTKAICVNDIEYVKEDQIYLIVLESHLLNNMFQYYSRNDFKIENLLSPRLIDMFKKNTNFKLVFLDRGEGAYPHTIEFLQKINNFLIRNSIQEKNKVFISTNNNFIYKLKESNLYESFLNKINIFPNNYFLLTSGRFIGELRSSNNLITENNYNFSIQEEIHFENREKYFLMYNRNSERIHRVYFVNKLYENNLLDKGMVSFFENPYLNSFLENSKIYEELKLQENDIDDIRKNYKNFTPMYIDNPSAEEVADYHNFLSRKNEYENTYFTIVSETNAESDYCFITEKTTKPIMNLHPFVVLGNPHTLKILKSYGLKTFDKWWDESYDNEFDFKERSKMVLNIVNDLCSKTKEEWNELLKDMSDTLYFNKKQLHKLNYTKIYEKEFFKNFFPHLIEKTI